MKNIVFTALILGVLATAAVGEMTKRTGWWVQKTDKPFDTLVDDVKSAVKANKFGVVTQAGPTNAAKRRGITIPGNRVIGVFNNVYAVRILNLSTAAMIEAPIRMYVTQNPDGTATLSYKEPSTIFAPYFDEGGVDLEAAADELDATFRKIAILAAR